MTKYYRNVIVKSEIHTGLINLKQMWTNIVFEGGGGRGGRLTSNNKQKINFKNNNFIDARTYMDFSTSIE